MAMSIPSAHSITQMMSADGWFFRFQVEGKPRLLRLAAWGLDHCGRIVGMVSASTADLDYAHLVMVPPNTGVYLHEGDFSNEDKLLLMTNKPSGLDLIYPSSESA